MGLVQESKIRKTKMMFVSYVKQVIRIAAHQAFFARDQKKDEMKNKSENT